MTKMIRCLLAGLVLSATMTVAALAAGVAINADSSGLALRGHDPVAYFTQGAPTPGDRAISAVHDGATYHFASEANRDTFLANPAAYLPAYGGYCAFGTAMGYKVDGDPEAWKIVDNRLYLNYSKGVQRRWESRQAHYITTADDQWSRIRDKSPEELRP